MSMFRSKYNKFNEIFLLLSNLGVDCNEAFYCALTENYDLIKDCVNKKTRANEIKNIEIEEKWKKINGKSFMKQTFKERL